MDSLLQMKNCHTKLIARYSISISILLSLSLALLFVLGDVILGEEQPAMVFRVLLIALTVVVAGNAALFVIGKRRIAGALIIEFAILAGWILLTAGHSASTGSADSSCMISGVNGLTLLFIIDLFLSGLLSLVRIDST